MRMDGGRSHRRTMTPPRSPVLLNGFLQVAGLKTVGARNGASGFLEAAPGDCRRAAYSWISECRRSTGLEVQARLNQLGLLPAVGSR